MWIAAASYALLARAQETRVLRRFAIETSDALFRRPPGVAYPRLASTSVASNTDSQFHSEAGNR